MAYKSRSKDTYKTTRHNIHIVDCDESSIDDESSEVYAAKLVWPTKAKPPTCFALQLVQKSWQEEVKFTFNVAKCDKIFDELLKSGNFKINHSIPSADELKIHAY